MNDLFKMNDRTAEFEANEAQTGKAMGILSYIGLLALIPYFAEKENKWVRFHAVQGINLLIISAIFAVGVNILSTIFILIPYIGVIITTIISVVDWIVRVVFLILAIMGIVYSAQGKAIELPLLNKIQIVKK